ncbi:hypothetical protein BGZ83_004642 [Gryganskiella cystojenkinii]|nr:hypothetical protein BGZ83_004642 [Gryganskiella cystojenkinii]
MNLTDYYKTYEIAGPFDRDAVLSCKGRDLLLTIFHASNIDIWLDRNAYKVNLNQNRTDPLDGHQGLEVLDRRSHKEGWFMMAEATSVDKMMHLLDYDRVLADLLELDSTFGKTKEWLKPNRLHQDTLILTTADHGHSFDVYASVDTQYFNSFGTTRSRRRETRSVPTGTRAGPLELRYTLAAGTVPFPTHPEDFHVNVNGHRVTAIAHSD